MCVVCCRCVRCAQRHVFEGGLRCGRRGCDDEHVCQIPARSSLRQPRWVLLHVGDLTCSPAHPPARVPPARHVPRRPSARMRKARTCSQTTRYLAKSTRSDSARYAPPSSRASSGPRARGPSATSVRAHARAASSQVPRSRGPYSLAALALDWLALDVLRRCGRRGLDRSKPIGDHPMGA